MGFCQFILGCIFPLSIIIIGKLISNIQDCCEIEIDEPIALENLDIKNKKKKNKQKKGEKIIKLLSFLLVLGDVIWWVFDSVKIGTNNCTDSNGIKLVQW